VGHPTGATGVHQAVTILEQLTGKAGDSQIKIPADKPYGLTLNMGGNDKRWFRLFIKEHKALLFQKITAKKQRR